MSQVGADSDWLNVLMAGMARSLIVGSVGKLGDWLAILISEFFSAPLSSSVANGGTSVI